MMALTNVELYEALKPTVGEEAARLMAEIVPAAADVALKSDVAAVQGEMREGFANVRGEMREGFANVRGEMREGFAAVREEFATLRGDMDTKFASARADTNAQNASLLKWMIAMFVPVWVGSWATVVAIVLQG